MPEFIERDNERYVARNAVEALQRRPLVFGDPELIRAVQFLSDVESAERAAAECGHSIEGEVLIAPNGEVTHCCECLHPFADAVIRAALRRETRRPPHER